MRKTFITLLSLFVAALVVVSCDGSPGTTTMRLLMKDCGDNAKTFYPSSSYDAAQYVIEGRYIGNANVARDHFSIATTSRSVSVEGLAVGQWHVYVKAENPRGDTIVEGEADIDLRGSSGTHTVVLDSYVGTGSVNITVRWAYGKLDNPQLRISLQPVGGEPVSKDEFIVSDQANGCALYSESGIPSGSYLVLLTLWDGEFCIAGMVEALRVSANDTTDGILSFDSESGYSQYAGNLFMLMPGGTSLEGSIVPVVGNTLYSDEETLITFKPDTDIGEDSNYVVMWYLDGVAIGSPQRLLPQGNSVLVQALPGNHILSVVVVSTGTGMAGSASWAFTSKLSGDAGALSYSHTISQRSVGIAVSESSSMALLPGGRVLFASPDVNNIYLCSLTSTGGLRLEDSYSYADFSWCNGVFDICSDPGFNVFAIRFRRNGSEGIAIMKYDPAKDEISVLQYKVGEACYDMVFQGTYGHFMNGNEPMGAIGSLDFAVTDQNNGSIYIAQQNSQMLYIINIKDGEVQCFSKAGKPALCDIVAISPDYSEMSVFSSSAKGFYTISLVGATYGLPPGNWVFTDTDDYVIAASYLANGDICVLTGSDFTVYGSSVFSVRDTSDVLCVAQCGNFAYTADRDCNIYHHIVVADGIRSKDELMDCPIVEMVSQDSFVMSINTDGDIFVYSIAGNGTEEL